MLVNLEPDEQGVIVDPAQGSGRAPAPAHRGRRSARHGLPVDFAAGSARPSSTTCGWPADWIRPSTSPNSKQITAVDGKQPFVLADITSSRFETYDSLARVYTLYATLSNDATLVEFGFVLNWPNLKPEEKREKYSKYACHELNFFLFQKDPEFFQTVVLPYLKNKKDKQFLDHWLLSDDLSAYLQPWHYAQLNVVERILLSQRAGRGPAAHGARRRRPVRI